MSEPDEYSFQQMMQNAGERRNPNTATFYYHPVLNKHKTRETGREIYEDKVYILILCPGQSKTEMRRPATDEDKKIYQAEWKAFQDGKAAPLVGTPIEQLPGVTPARAMEFHRLHIRTIEQLVEVPDQNISGLGIDGHALRNAAKAFVEKNSAEIQGLKAQNALLMKKLAETQQQMLELMAKVDTLGNKGQQPAPNGNPKPEVDAGAVPNEF